MRVENCPKCGRLFTKIVALVCPQCEKLDEEQFQKLRKYIEEEPLANISQVSDATGVSPKRILQYIREGRLTIPEGMIEDVRCTQCGEPITEGSFCTPCAAKLAKDMADVYANPPTIPEKSPVAEKEPKLNRRGVGMHIRAQKKKK